MIGECVLETTRERCDRACELLASGLRLVGEVYRTRGIRPAHLRRARSGGVPDQGVRLLRVVKVSKIVLWHGSLRFRLARVREAQNTKLRLGLRVILTPRTVAILGAGSRASNLARSARSDDPPSRSVVIADTRKTMAQAPDRDQAKDGVPVVADNEGANAFPPSGPR